MKYVMFSLLFILAAFFTHLLFISDWSEFNRSGILSSHGRISEGTKFGLSIGMDMSEVNKIMSSRGFELIDATNEPVDRTKKQSCHGYDYEDRFALTLWWDRSWRKGAICIVDDGGKISHISWIYGMFQP